MRNVSDDAVETLMSALRSEYDQAIGVDHSDDTLSLSRTAALEAYRGVRSGRVPEERDSEGRPKKTGRSAVTSRDVFETIEAALPDIIEIFLSDDDIVTFRAQSEEDEETATSETAAVRHVLFSENNGFKLIYTAVKDAFLSKLGIFTWYWREFPPKIEMYSGYTPDNAVAFAHARQMLGDQIEYQDREDGLVDIRVTRMLPARLMVEAVAPEDFFFARDLVGSAREAAYCGCRKFVRAQDLIEFGVDPELAARLPGASYTRSHQERYARDTASETEHHVRGNASGNPGLNLVEVIEHYVRLDLDGDGQTEVYRVLTSGPYGAFEPLQIEQVPDVPIAVMTAIPMPHRVLGLSLADVAIEVQELKTALWRLTLDHSYYSLNSRYQIAEAEVSETTYTDLRTNQPGAAIRSRTGAAIKPLPTGQLAFDALGMLEYTNTVLEQRTGVYRAAQGLAPDTLHDTAAGARQLLSSAQKRMRLMARSLAETGLRDLFLGIHTSLRNYATGERQIKLGGKWAKIDPSLWPEREDLVVKLGVGSDERADELAAITNVLGLQIQAVERQGGVEGPFVRPEHIYNTLKRIVSLNRLSDVNQYFADPANAPPPEPKPNPAEEKMRMEMEIERAKLDLQAEKNQGELQLSREKAQAEAQLAREKMQAELQLNLMRPVGNHDIGAGVKFGGAVG